MSDAPTTLPPDLQAEVERQHALIMRGTQYGDAQTAETMARELRERLAQSLQEKRPLRVYLGVDPTAPDLHLGHCVALRKLRLFQDLGHQAILVIGDFTSLVGDPSDKDSLRPMQARERIEANAQTYQDQAFKLLDKDRTEVRRNSEWLDRLNFREVVHLAANFTVQQFLERDTFKRRMDAQQPVYLHEFMYGLMQAEDAYQLKADVQLGGTDQTFNIMAGRILQRAHEEPSQIAVLNPILVGTDGALRMSKSTGNYIGIDEPPTDQYGKAMSVPDAVLPAYFTLATNLSPEEGDAIIRDLGTGALHPMDAKKRLAHAIASEWHGPAAANAAAEHFDRVFSQRETPDEMPEFALAFDGAESVDVALPELLADSGTAPSKGEAKRLVAQGAVSLNDERVRETMITLRPGDVLKVGRRRWLRIVRK